MVALIGTMVGQFRDNNKHCRRRGTMECDRRGGGRWSRPIILTAALAMICCRARYSGGAMAVAIMGGKLIATALTLLFLPALYAA